MLIFVVTHGVMVCAQQNKDKRKASQRDFSAVLNQSY